MIRLAFYLTLLLLSPLTQAVNCRDVFPSAATAHASNKLTLPDFYVNNDDNINLYGTNTLLLEQGDSFYANGIFKDDSELKIDGRSARIYLKSMTTGTSTELNNYNPPENLILLVDGNVNIRDATVIHGIIYATGTINLSHSAYVIGAMTAENGINFGDSSAAYYDPAAINNADFGDLCSNGGSASGHQFEFGRDDSGSVTFGTEFTNTPVVILMPTIDSSAPNSDGPATVRLTSVTTTGFSYIQESPTVPSDGTAAVSMDEIAWMAFATGEGTLPDGYYYMAGIEDVSGYIVASGDKTGRTDVYFSSDYAGNPEFGSIPQIFHQRQSYNNNCWLTSHADREQTNYLKLALEQAGVYNSSDTTCIPGGTALNSLSSEQIGWVALESTSGTLPFNGGDVLYEIGSGITSDSASEVTPSEQCSYLNSFSQSFDAPPSVFAKIKSRRDANGGWLRSCNISSTQFSIVADEDEYLTSDRTRNYEEFAFFALQPPANPVPGLQFTNTQTDALTCDAHSITLQALLDEVLDTTFEGTVTLSTSTDQGIWSLETGSGTFSGGDNDGIASYTFSTDDAGEATFGLFHADSGTVTITATGDEAIATIDITFRPYGFRTSLDTSPYTILTANTEETVTISAVGLDESGTGCSPITTYEGDKSVSFWTTHEDPGSSTTALSIDGSEIANDESSAAAQTVTFTGGVATLTLNYPDAGQVKLNSKDADDIADGASGGTGGAILGESSFIVNPAALYFISIEDSSANSNPGGSATSGAAFTSAGSSFNVEVAAVMTKGSLSCTEVVSGYCVTPSFNHDSVTLTHTLLTPASGVAGNLNGTTTEAASSGLISYSALNYSEVGSISLTVTAADYLQTGNTLTATSSAVGRFYPAQIILNSALLTPACDSFTYMEQPELELSYTLNAQNLQGKLTQNYNTDTYLTDGTTTLTARDASDDYSARLTHSTLSNDWELGVLDITDSSAGLARDSSPDGPISDLLIGLYYVGGDGETLTPINFSATDTDCSTNDTCDALSLGSAGDFYYGRFKPVNGFGSELSAIRASQRIELYISDNSRFVINDLDECTALNGTQFTLDPDNGSGELTIGSGSSALTIETISNGLLPLLFSAPGEGNSGSGRFTIDLQTALPWLMYDWDGDSSDDTSVTGEVSFGIYRGSSRLIYRRESQ